MKPSELAGIDPCNSVTQKSECETIAQNVMKILKRTGDEWRELTWEEYKEERLKDKNFSEYERQYFDRIKEYTINESVARTFAKRWDLA